MAKMDIAVALGGGGPRGYAHIGVLRRLEQEGFHIHAITGASAGGIIAVTYSVGYTPDELETLFSTIDQSALILRSPDEGPAVLGLTGASMLLKEYLDGWQFEDLPIPCSVVAVDLKTGREVHLNHGPVFDAVLATIAVPGVFPPMEKGDSVLVDGAVLNPVPVSIARTLAPGLPVLAVTLDDQPGSVGNLDEFLLPVQMPAPLAKRLTRTRLAKSFSLFLQSVDVGSRKLAALRLKAEPPDFLVRPDVSGIGLLDQVDVHAVVKLGEKAFDQVLPDLQRLVGWPARLARTVFPPR